MPTPAPVSYTHLDVYKRQLLDPAQRPVIVENIPIRRESEFREWLPIMDLSLIHI